MTPEQITRVAHITGCPEKNVAANWPAIETCLRSLNIYSAPVAIAALGTIAVETAHTFRPVHEFGTVAYLNKMYDCRTDLGNTAAKDGDGAKYCGRGYVQITGESNYARYGRLLGVDLIADPDLALDPNCAASIFAAYFYEHHIQVPADLGNWTRVRELVNGGHNGLAEFIGIVNKLKEVIA
jgi:putative chitinase